MPQRLTNDQLEQRIRELEAAESNLRQANETLRKQMETALREDELRYQALFYAAADAILFIDNDTGQILAANSRAEALFGYSREELLARKNWELSAEPEETWRRTQGAKASPGEVITVPLRYLRRKDGTVLPAELTCRSFFWRDRAVFIAAFRDITDRKKMEDALRESEAKYRALIDQAAEGIVLVDSETLRILDFNEAACAGLGYSREEFAGLALQDVQGSLREDAFLEGFRAVVEAGGGKFENRQRRKDGTLRQTIVSNRVISLQGRKYLAEIWQDATERMTAEEALRKSEEKFRTVANYIKDWEYWSAVDGSLVFVSPSCEKITGYTAAEFIQDPELLQRIIHGDDLEEFLSHQRSVATRPTGESCELENFRIITKNGEERWIAHTCTAVFDDRGEHIGRRISNQDITIRKRAQQEKQRIQQQLIQAQKMEAIGTLAGGIAHDFNNILGAILGFAEMAYEDSLAGRAQPSDLAQIIEAGNRAKELVKQILSFSRQSDAQKIPLRPAALIEESLKLLRSSIPKTIDIHRDIDPKAHLIHADPTQVHQIVMNLCTNAYHAMEKNGGTLEVSLQNKVLTQEALRMAPYVQPGPFIQLSIRDTGSGIPPEIMERIFEPYFTTKEVGKGTGMGLAMVHGIVKNSGGFLTCHSRVGEGTRFDIFLPASREMAGPETAGFESVPVGSERILFVDDEEILADMGGNLLKRLGYQVTVRKSSFEALAAFEACPDAVDLVITDHTMPGMTGVDMARRMLEIRPDIPIILCTGYSNQVSQESAARYGIKGYAMKPLTRTSIATLIRSALDEGKG